MSKGKLLSAVIFAFAALALPLRGELVLAENGNTSFDIVRHGDSAETALAAADLAAYLTRITGAKFVQNGGTKHHIHLGKAAPSDKEPLKPCERRVRSEGGDLYLYGEGPYGTAFAVYDFLEHFFGCRWYTMRGQEKIPANRNPKFAEIAFSRVPSFPHPHITGGVWFPAKKQLDDFTRRNRIFARQRDIVQIGPDYSHVPGKLIPPGKEFKKQVGLWLPYRISKNDAYFATHPEYFAQNPQGKRVPNRQLCYSNPEVRKLFDSKMEQIIAEEYKGGIAYLRCDLNDDNGFDGKTICCCPGCMKLVEKYRSPAGPYWDYVLEVCRRFQKKYPGIVLMTTAYLTTEIYPPGVERMPDNLVVRFCPLNKNYLKPYDHATNGRVIRRFKEWGPRCRNMWVQLYPSIYPRITTTLPVCANLRQLAQNLRVCKQYGIANVDLEQGHIWCNVNAFNELREYMLARLLNDVTLDENQVIEEFIRDNYGKAADLVLAYWRELEELEAKEPVGLAWTGLNFGSFTYLATENLVRWSRNFDKMETLTADDPAALKLVRDLRFNLDEAILEVNFRMPKGEEFAPAKVAARARRNFEASLADFAASLEGKAAQRRPKYMRAMRLVNGLEFFEAQNHEPKPLPEGLRRNYSGKVLRVLPTRQVGSQTSHIRQLSDDPDAAFGVAMKGSSPKKDFYVVTFSMTQPSGDRFLGLLNDFKKITHKELQTHTGKYRLYYFGSTRLYPQYWVGLWQLCGGIAAAGQFCDAADPEAEYDVYVSLKLDKDGAIWVGEVVLCATGKKAAPMKMELMTPAG